MSLAVYLATHNIAYGAIIALAFCTGMETSPWVEEADPMGVVEVGTLDSQLSSSCERVAPSSVYHDPACEGWRVAGAIECAVLQDTRNSVLVKL
jgi:hypothetical protein